MKYKKLFLALMGLVLCLLIVILIVQNHRTKEAAAEFESILFGKGSFPQWSPDRSKIAFIAEDGWLTITDADGKGEIKKVALRNFGSFHWLDSTTFLTISGESRVENGTKAYVWIIKTLTQDGKESLIVEDVALKGQEHNIYGPLFLKDGTVGYYEGPFSLPGKDKVFKVIKAGKLKPEEATKELKAVTRGDIWLESIDGAIKRKITSGTYYRGARLSPDGTKIMTNNSRGDILIVDLEGNVLSSLGVGVYEGWTPDKGAGGYQKWSPDSKQIVYALVVESEYDIEASELFIINWDGTERRQITDTPDEIEVDPTWSPDGTMIFYRLDNINEIFMIKVK